MSDKNIRLVVRGQLAGDENPIPVVMRPDAGPVTPGTAAAIAAVDAAPDRAAAYTYLDAGTPDQRVSTIVRSSASLGLSYTETFTYGGASGGYYATNVVRS